MSSTPTAEMPIPAYVRKPGRSRSTTIASNTVKTAWHCRTSADNPAGIPAAMPANSSEYCAIASVSAVRAIQRHFAVGRPTTKIAGTAATRNRTAQKSSGDIESRPTRMTTKLNPQMTATSTARATSFGFTVPAW